MATMSMAAALAATLPTAQVAPRSTAQYDSLPPTMTQTVDAEANIPVTSVQLDALVRSHPHLSVLNAQSFLFFFFNITIYLFFFFQC